MKVLVLNRWSSVVASVASMSIVWATFVARGGAPGTGHLWTTVVCALAAVAVGLGVGRGSDDLFRAMAGLQAIPALAVAPGELRQRTLIRSERGALGGLPR